MNHKPMVGRVIFTLCLSDNRLRIQAAGYTRHNKGRIKSMSRYRYNPYMGWRRYVTINDQVRERIINENKYLAIAGFDPIEVPEGLLGLIDAMAKEKEILKEEDHE